MVLKKVKKYVKVAVERSGKLLQTAPKLKFYFGWHYKHSPVKSNRVLFESFHGKNISDSPLAVLEELVASGESDQYELFYSTDDVARDRVFVEANDLPVTLVDINSRRYPEVLATSKYLINNSSFPVYFIRKPDQVYVQTWHGTPLKTLGKRMRLGIESMYNVQHNFIQASCLTFPNDFTRDVIMRDYNLEDLFTGTVAMVGYPRNSVFLQGENKRIRQECGLEGFQTFAYMPTWRGASNHAVSIDGYKKQVEGFLARIDANLRDDQKLFVNFHSMVAASIELGEYKHIFPFPATVGNYDFLSQVDALITDYSSVFFDYALTGKPVVLFAYDLEEYIGERGFYFSIEELPFPLVRTIDELIDCIKDGVPEVPAADYDEFYERFLKYDTRDNSRYVLNLLLGRPTPTVPKISFAENKKKEWRLFNPSQQNTLADINSIFDSADPASDIIALSRPKFGMTSSAFVHDNFRDGWNYLFVTRTTPRTFAEDVLSRVASSTKMELREREHKRLLGDLNVVGEHSDYCIVEKGYSYSSGACVELESRVVVGEGFFAVYFPHVPGKLDKAFVAKGREICWIRSLVKEEVEGGFALFEVADLLTDLDLRMMRNGRYNVGASFVSEEDGSTQVALGVQGGHYAGKVAAPFRYMQSIVVFPEELKIEALREDPRYEGSIIARAQGRGISVTPYYKSNGQLALLARYQGEAARDYLKPKLVYLTASGNKPITIIARVRSGNYRITNALLINREESIGDRFKLPCTIKKVGSWNYVSVRFDPDEYDLDGVLWDFALEVDEGAGYTSFVYVITSFFIRNFAKVVNVQRCLENGNIIFPYSAAGRKLAFTHRPPTASDTQVTKFREIAAFWTFFLLYPYWSKKRLWLVYEKYCSLAQDNAFHFFEYCMNEAGSEARDFVYYVIDKNSPDFANVAQYGKNVVDFMSFRHMLYCMVANIYIASDSKTHLYQWRPKPSVVRDRFSRHDIFFLQHGVTALKRVDKLFGKNASSPMTYFLTTSKREQDIVVENFGYSPEEAPVLGFSRWDVLLDDSSADAPVILLMPTWRSWLEEQSDDVFIGSEYFQVYSSLIRSEELQEVLKSHNARLKFFIHPKLSMFMSSFGETAPNVELVEMGSQPLNELIMECSMLITDYSSVCWDVLYMGKPVVYYQFDQQRYKDDIGAYIDLDSDLPGALCKTEEECIAAVDEYASSGFKQSDSDKSKADEFLPVVDRGNRARTYHFLVDAEY